MLLAALLGVALSQQALAAAGPRISNVVVSNVAIDSAQISWDTDVPSTTQVIVADIEYQPHRRVPEPKDTMLVTAHRVVLDGLVPNSTYWFYVVSEDSGHRLATTYDLNNRAKFQTPAVDPAAPFDYRLDSEGPRNVYAGHDLYIKFTALSLGSDLGHVYFLGAGGFPAGATAHLMCTDDDANPLNDGDDAFTDAASHLPYCWVNPNNYKRDAVVRISAPETAEGQFTAVLEFRSKGIAKTVQYPFTVRKPPAPAPPAEIAAVPPIPDLARWQDTMTYLGKRWCNPAEIMSFGYEPQIWYYDGGRTFFQIADYTKDPDTWNPCALNIINQYRDRIIARNGYYEGWRVFPHGLAMNYWRNGDDQSRQAVVLLSRSSAFAKSGGRVSVEYIRETAYIIEAYVKAEQLGEPRSPYLARAVDFALGQFDQMFASNPVGFNQMFYDGLMAEALIQYYELTGDARVPPAIKQMLDWLWANAYSPVMHAFAYNSTLVPQSYDYVQSNLIVPAFAWYWHLTGDPVYLQRGDEAFAHALDTDISYSGKIFNQNYRWSFDYVRLRSNGQAFTTSPATNTPARVAETQNRPPVVSAGVDQAIAWPANSVMLTGTAIDPDGMIARQVWTQLSGPGSVAFSAPDSLSTTATFSGPGVFVLQLTAFDAFTSTSSSVTVTVGPSWYDGAWQYRKRITVDRSKVAAAVVGFPALVTVTHPDLKSSANGGKVASDTGADILFANGANIAIPFEIERYDAASGELIAWVKANLSPDTDTDLFLYFGNPSAPGPQNWNAVWDQDYKGVWHLGEAGPASYGDSTASGNGGSSPVPPAAVPGRIGGGQRFGLKNHITLGVPGAIRLGNRFTWEGWVNVDTFPWASSRSFFSQGPKPNDAYPPTLMVNSNFQLQAMILQWGQVAATGTGVLSAGQWYHVAYVRDGIGATSRFYVNGSPVPLTVNAAGTNMNFTDATGDTYLGRDLSGGAFTGAMDEVRISGIARSAGWIATEYRNQGDPASFSSIGPTETSLK